MSIFKKRVTGTNRSFSEIYNDCMEEVEKVVNLSLKASGIELTDMLEGLDEENGAMVGGLMSSCNKLMELSAEMISKYDAQEKLMTEMNEKLLAQNGKLEKILLAVQK